MIVHQVLQTAETPIVSVDFFGEKKLVIDTMTFPFFLDFSADNPLSASVFPPTSKSGKPREKLEGSVKTFGFSGGKDSGFASFVYENQLTVRGRDNAIAKREMKFHPFRVKKGTKDIVFVNREQIWWVSHGEIEPKCWQAETADMIIDVSVQNRRAFILLKRDENFSLKQVDLEKNGDVKQDIILGRGPQDWHRVWMIDSVIFLSTEIEDGVFSLYYPSFNGVMQKVFSTQSIDDFRVLFSEISEDSGTIYLVSEKSVLSVDIPPREKLKTQRPMVVYLSQLPHNLCSKIEEKSAENVGFQVHRSGKALAFYRGNDLLVLERCHTEQISQSSLEDKARKTIAKRRGKSLETSYIKNVVQMHLDLEDGIPRETTEMGTFNHFYVHGIIRKDPLILWGNSSEKATRLMDFLATRDDKKKIFPIFCGPYIVALLRLSQSNGKSITTCLNLADNDAVFLSEKFFAHSLRTIMKKEHKSNASKGLLITGLATHRYPAFEQTGFNVDKNKGAIFLKGSNIIFRKSSVEKPHFFPDIPPTKKRKISQKDPLQVVTEFLADKNTGLVPIPGDQYTPTSDLYRLLNQIFSVCSFTSPKEEQSKESPNQMFKMFLDKLFAVTGDFDRDPIWLFGETVRGRKMTYSEYGARFNVVRKNLEKCIERYRIWKQVADLDRGVISNSWDHLRNRDSYFYYLLKNPKIDEISLALLQSFLFIKLVIVDFEEDVDGNVTYFVSDDKGRKMMANNLWTDRDYEHWIIPSDPPLKKQPPVIYVYRIPCEEPCYGLLMSSEELQACFLNTKHTFPTGQCKDATTDATIFHPRSVIPKMLCRKN